MLLGAVSVKVEVPAEVTSVRGVDRSVGLPTSRLPSACRRPAQAKPAGGVRERPNPAPSTKAPAPFSVNIVDWPLVWVKMKCIWVPSIFPKRIVAVGLVNSKGSAVAVTDCVAPAGSFILSFSGTEVDAQLFGLFKQDFDWQPGTLPLLVSQALPGRLRFLEQAGAVSGPG